MKKNKINYCWKESTKGEKFLLVIAGFFDVLLTPLILTLKLSFTILLWIFFWWTYLPKIKKSNEEFKAMYIRHLQEEKKRLEDQKIREQYWRNLGSDKDDTVKKTKKS